MFFIQTIQQHLLFELSVFFHPMNPKEYCQMIQSYNQASGDLSISQGNEGKKTNQGFAPMRDSLDGSDEEEHRQIEVLRRSNKFGKMKVLYNGFTLVTLGPDYTCFLPTFLLFIGVSYLVIDLVNHSAEGDLFKIVTVFICVGQCLAYLLVALSNPGIVTEPANELPSEESKNCIKCLMKVPRHSRHCNDCDVCIADYDHHCPWTSKCIGGGNLIRFYIFLGWTPVYLIYITIAFVMCMSNNLIKIQQLQKHP